MSNVPPTLIELDKETNTNEHLLKVQQTQLKDRLKADLPDYENDTFPWTTQLYRLAQEHWHIGSFRTLQPTVMNAALDRQWDVFVVLPTGGGKSLCYQLPALVEPGFTLVVSPLVSLIKDQVHDLHRANVDAAYLTGSTSKQDATRIQHAMVEPTFKLLYVTPEKIAKSRVFLSTLGLAYRAGRLDRIVIDEAHCCSQQGHDFRPDYIKLNVLRATFPKTPMMALTATCPWHVMKDVMQILGLETHGTLIYTAPFYRPNLVYTVLPKPDTHQDQMKCMTHWILNNYPTSPGIIYCLTRKETAVIAGAVYRHSHGQIQCGCYHADMDDEDKASTHQLWRQKKLQVMVATIAFGMGVNHLETRFVIHHTVAKSVEGYYQESGRAGRDGKQAHCVLYYRGQDVATLSSMTVRALQGRENLNAMIRYGQSYTTCRNLFFEKHLDVLQPHNKRDTVRMKTTCGTCDNCVRDPSTVVLVNIGQETRTLIMILRRLKLPKERVTMNKLISLWQGKGLKALGLETLKKDSTVAIPVDRKFTMGDLENIINYLITLDYLMDDYYSTTYGTFVYVLQGPKAQELVLGNGPNALDIQMEFLQKKPTHSAKRRKQSTRPKNQEN